MRYYCTYFDSNYLCRGLALYQSLSQHSKDPFRLWILCFDGETHDILRRLNLPNVELIAEETFLRDDPALARTRYDRSRVEYYWTCTPSLLRFVLQRHPEVDVITYLDADQYFFADPRPIHDEIQDASILICGHRFPATLQDFEKYGIYNIGVLSFRRDPSGVAALEWWRERCIEWCYDRLEGEKFGDQKYLDDWPERFPGVRVLGHKGIGLAPWNIAGYRIAVSGGRPLVDDVPLVLYHFHRFQVVATWAFGPKVSLKALNVAEILKIYLPYARALLGAYELVRGVYPSYYLRKKQVSTYALIGGILKGRYFTTAPTPLALPLAALGTSTANSSRLARYGVALYQRGQISDARKYLLEAAFRGPWLILEKSFRYALLGSLWKLWSA